MKKRRIGIAAAVIILAMLLPVRLEMDDGGSEEYSALLYRVTLRHTMAQQEGVFGYLMGTEIQILGFDVYSDVRFELDH